MKEVLILRSEFIGIGKAKDLKFYISGCINKGSAADLYKNPFIDTAFYNAGRFAETELQNSMDVYGKVKTTDNNNIVSDKIGLAVIWINAYADKVDIIANTDANRTT